MNGSLSINGALTPCGSPWCHGALVFFGSLFKMGALHGLGCARVSVLSSCLAGRSPLSVLSVNMAGTPTARYSQFRRLAPNITVLSQPTAGDSACRIGFDALVKRYTPELRLARGCRCSHTPWLARFHRCSHGSRLARVYRYSRLPRLTQQSWCSLKLRLVIRLHRPVWWGDVVCVASVGDDPWLRGLLFKLQLVHDRVQVNQEMFHCIPAGSQVDAGWW